MFICTSLFVGDAIKTTTCGIKFVITLMFARRHGRHGAM